MASRTPEKSLLLDNRGGGGILGCKSGVTDVKKIAHTTGRGITHNDKVY
jgi:hypothetical protein